MDQQRRSILMDQEQLQLQLDVSDVDGKEKLVRQVQDAKDVREALARTSSRPEVVATLLKAVNQEDSAVFIWGATGLAIVTVLENHFDGRFAFVVWGQNDRHFTVKQVAPVIELWAETKNCKRVAAAVDRAGPWRRLTGYSPWKLIISKEI